MTNEDKAGKEHLERILLDVHKYVLGEVVRIDLSLDIVDNVRTQILEFGTRPKSDAVDVGKIAFQLANNAIHSLREKRERRRQLLNGLASFLDGTECLPSGWKAGDDVVELVSEAIDSLAFLQRQMIIYRIILGLPEQEIIRKLRIPDKVQYMAALRKALIALRDAVRERLL